MCCHLLAQCLRVYLKRYSDTARYIGTEEAARAREGTSEAETLFECKTSSRKQKMVKGGRWRE